MSDLIKWYLWPVSIQILLDLANKQLINTNKLLLCGQFLYKYYQILSQQIPNLVTKISKSGHFSPGQTVVINNNVDKSMAVSTDEEEESSNDSLSVPDVDMDEEDRWEKVAILATKTVCEERNRCHFGHNAVYEASRK